jgi:hypothetical protein
MWAWVHPEIILFTFMVWESKGNDKIQLTKQAIGGFLLMGL